MVMLCKSYHSHLTSLNQTHQRKKNSTDQRKCIFFFIFICRNRQIKKNHFNIHKDQMKSKQSQKPNELESIKIYLREKIHTIFFLSTFEAGINDLTSMRSNTIFSVDISMDFLGYYSMVSNERYMLHFNSCLSPTPHITHIHNLVIHIRIFGIYAQPNSHEISLHLLYSHTHIALPSEKKKKKMRK